MKPTFIIILLIILSFCADAQNTFKALVRNDRTKEVLKGATVTIPALKIVATSDTSGLISINNVPNGRFEISISFIGFGKQEKTISFPLTRPEQVVEFGLEPQSDQLDEVIIQTTRINQNLRDIPTRIEALPLEELDEKSTMRPGDIKMLLGEATGILVQQTSMVSGNASFRIQGLDSKYTQLLQDGMPMYQGFSGGLSLLQVSPLDLRQVEFIKGSASTLYGGGAIAGLVNLITKTPDQPETTFLLNTTSTKSADLSGFYSQKWKHIGTTLFGAYNYSHAYDPSHTGFTAIPQTNRFTFNPKVFLYLDGKNSGWFGVNTTYENRFGGDIQVVRGHAGTDHQYFERNKTFRFSTQLSFTHQIDQSSSINIKNTMGYFDRQLNMSALDFGGKQLSSFSEANYVSHQEKLNWVAGINLVTDHFTSQHSLNDMGYHQTTWGAFVQNVYKATDWFSIESGLRVDYNRPSLAQASNGLLLLPRLNGLFKLNEQLTSRIGGGLGYKMPTPFNDRSEQEGYANLKPFISSQLMAEKSYGLNGDLNYRTTIGDALLSVNQLFFFTKVNHPLMLENNALLNAQGYVRTHGAETNLKVAIDELGLYLGYTYTATKLYDNKQFSTQPLTPKHRLSFDATYEIEDSFRFGAESFYTGSQLLSDGTVGRQFITFGLLVQKMWKHLDLFVNAENLTDRRQTRWDNIYTGTMASPKFRDVYAPMEGRVINAGIRIKLK
ncbi:TonB-dependent receptor plug domain-containing protein [Pedobacter sp. KR3-3]|uniref:TonB-dependent receptor plug domain-containing protein n=1 Tax=Pedobacter albus TaxID=3113905 RepID=A0ABU7I518_9SPHI|nr:TonB-dependent receptor plug domain-containing protein [Pedobacter sp. KR3-3]MEE1944538.1 TonB-dependent receptor plug domain-containing protein [Pedobacter sp. KR3-3]